MEIYYHDYLFSISIFGYVFVSTCCAESLYRKTSVGETHHDAKMKFDWETHELWKVINQGPRRRSGPRAATMVSRLASSLGRLASLCASSPHALSMVRFEPNTLYFHMFCFPFRTKLKITW
jgi:hypothetical protein